MISREQFAITKIKPRSGASFAVSISVEVKKDSWLLELKKTDEKVVGPKRLRLALTQLVLGNAAWIQKLRNGHIVNLEIPKESQQGVSQRKDLIKPLLMPARVEDKLYPFQRSGVAWLLRTDRAILADDMGLGKTAQALSAARRLFRKGLVSKCLIIAPGTLLANWEREAMLWAPELVTIVVRPSLKDREETWAKALKDANVVITSYEQIRNKIQAFDDSPLQLVIADEAHRLRKSSAQATKGFRKIRTDRFWALSGTPIENSPEDIATLLSLLYPKKFSPRNKNDRLSTLRSALQPVMLRRTKSQVLDDLPAVIESTEDIMLNSAQEVAYKKVIDEFRLSPKKSFLPVFQKLLGICDYEDHGKHSAKLDRIAQILVEINSSKEKAVVFSYTLEPLKLLEERLKQLEPALNSVLFTGEKSQEERDRLIREFKTDTNCSVFLASSRIASEGLTLTEANHVLFINRWWNPSSNQQARDRVVRIGQEQVVYVRNCVTQGTVESRVSQLLGEKLITFDELITSLENNPSGDLLEVLIS